MANNIVLFNTGRIWLATQLVAGGNTILDGNVTFRFFSNAPVLTPTGPSVPFIALVMPGYAPFVLSGATDGGIDTNGNDTWTWPATTVTCSSSVGAPFIAYGYWVTADSDGTVLWGQLFDTPAVWLGEDYAANVAPIFSLGTLVLP